MTMWWIIAAIVWGVPLIYSTPGALNALLHPHSARFGDPMRLGVWLVALLFVLHPLRFLLAEHNVSMMKALYVLGVIAAVQTVRLMRAYGRGS